MNLSPDYIKEHIEDIGFKQSFHLLKDLISDSNDPELRKEALEVYSQFDDGKNFRFFEQLFLSDEDLNIRLLAGKLLKRHYFNHKRLLSLLEFTLFSVENIDQKFLAIEILNSLKSKKAYKLIKDFLKSSIKEHFPPHNRDFPKEIFNNDYTAPIQDSILEICYNMILYNFYKDKYGFNVTLRNGIIILLNCEGSQLKKISDIPAFDKLVKLEYLMLQRNRIKKIENLEHMKKLKVLNLVENNMEKIQNLESLQNLEQLVLSKNQIKKIENLNLNNLKKLSLDYNDITQIHNLEYLDNLEFLNLGYNSISKIENLERLSKLETLILSNNNIEKISGLQNLTNLVSLRLNDNNIKYISGLDNLFQLKILNLSNNLIERMEKLDSLQNLTKLELSNNKIKKIEGLEHLLKLQELFLDKNYIESLDGLENLKSLIILFLERNNISEFRLSDIEHLRNLNFIFLNENPLTLESKKHYEKKIRFP